MTRRRLVGVALGMYVLALLVTAPATLLDAALNRISDGQLRLVLAEGTLWRGSGQLELRNPHGQRSLLQTTSWRLQARHLLRARLGFAVRLTAQAQPFELAVGIGSIELRQLSWLLPTSTLVRMDPRWSTLGLDGELAIDIAQLSIHRDRIDGNAVLHWRNASSTLSPVSPLGDYQLRLDGVGATMAMHLQTLRGPLQLDGSGHWRPGQRPSMTAIARVPAPLQPQLLPLLRMIAVERADGSFAFERMQ